MAEAWRTIRLCPGCRLRACDCRATERCPTCGSAVEVYTGDEGTSSFRPVHRSRGFEDGWLAAIESVTETLLARGKKEPINRALVFQDAAAIVARAALDPVEEKE